MEDSTQTQENRWQRAYRKARDILQNPIVRRVIIAVVTYWISRTEFAPMWAEVKGYLEL